VTDAARDTDDSPVEVEHVVALLRERLYGAISCLATLLAVRRTRLPWWQQAMAVAGLVGLGLLVVGIKMLAH
jgi:hypothetical protein